MLKRADGANARERALIAEEREAVDRDRAEWEVELARMTAVQPSSEDHFNLNVGGVRYDTSRTTLTRVPESMLATMFGERLDMLRRDPEDGSIFIDRDGERFGLVLDFLRDGASSQLAKTIQELPESQHEAMLGELEFFGLADAVFPPRPWFEGAEFRTLGPKLNRWCGAAVLHGRSIVVFGGVNGSTVFNTTEVLDLDAGTTEAFKAGPTMATARLGCAAVRLDARRVLVVGGSDNRASPAGSLDTTEILDLETMRFSAGPRMFSKRLHCAAVVLDVGRILVAGGRNNSRNYLRTTEILDIASMTFRAGPEMLSERSGCSAVAFVNPRSALIVGGQGSDNLILNTTEVLDIDTMAFSRGPTMRMARFGCAAVATGGGDSRHYLVVGGYDDGKKLNTTEVLDIETMEFTDGPAMLTNRTGCAALADDAGDRVLVLGGLRCAEVEVLSSDSRRLGSPSDRRGVLSQLKNYFRGR
jgi:hypothetical protein